MHACVLHVVTLTTTLYYTKVTKHLREAYLLSHKIKQDKVKHGRTHRIYMSLSFYL